MAVGGSGLTAWKVHRDGKSVLLRHALSIDGRDFVDVAVRPSGDKAIVMDRNGSLFAVNLDNGGRVQPLSIRARAQLRSLDFDSSGSRFTFVTPEGKLATCDWGPKGEGQSRSRPQAASFLGLGGGRWVAAAAPGHGVAIYDLEENQEWLTLPPESSDVWSLAWSPDCTRVAVGLSDGSVAIWNLEEVRARLAELGCVVRSTYRALPDPLP